MISFKTGHKADHKVFFRPSTDTFGRVSGSVGEPGVYAASMRLPNSRQGQHPCGLRLTFTESGGHVNAPLYMRRATRRTLSPFISLDSSLTVRFGVRVEICHSWFSCPEKTSYYKLKGSFYVTVCLLLTVIYWLISSVGLLKLNSGSLSLFMRPLVFLSVLNISL